MKNTCFVCLLFFFGLQLSCTHPEKKSVSISQLEWLIGNWEGQYNGKPFYEAWRRINDSTLINFTIEVSPADTAVVENGIIRVNPRQTTYQSATAKWVLEEATDTTMVFVNDTLKFANEIRWAHRNDNHWYTEIKNPDKKVIYDLVPVRWVGRYVVDYMLKANQPTK